MTRNAQQALLELSKDLLLLYTNINDLEQIQELGGILGWNYPQNVLENLESNLRSLRQEVAQIEGLIDNPPETIPELKAALRTARSVFRESDRLANSLRTFYQSLIAQGIVVDEPLDKIGSQLLELSTLLYLQEKQPLLHQVLSLLTIIQPNSQDVAPIYGANPRRLLRFPHQRSRLLLSRLKELLQELSTGTLELLQAEYLNSVEVNPGHYEVEINAEKLLPLLAELLGFLGITALYSAKPGKGYVSSPRESALVKRMMTFWYAPDDNLSNKIGATIAFPPRAERTQASPVMVILPFADGTFSSGNFSRQVGEWEIDFQGTANFGAVSLSSDGVEFEGTNFSQLYAKLTATRQALENTDEAVVWGSTTGTRLEIAGLTLTAEANIQPSDRDYGFGVSANHASLVIAPGDADRFLASILPAQGLRADFDLAFGWTHKRGLYLGGGVGLEYTIPLNSQNGRLPVTRQRNGVFLEAAHLSLTLANEDLRFATTVTASLQLGPVTAVVEQVGLRAKIDLSPNQAGNLGLIDVDLDFQPPSGIGLAIDASAISGGGFLSLSPDKNRWFGALSLEFSRRTLTGVVLSEQDSLLGIVWATGLGIPAPGGTIEGLGIIFGSDRRANSEAFIRGLKNNVLDAVLFPDDPIRQAPQLLTTLSELFPRANNYTLLGIMAQWVFGGEARLAVAELGILVELKGDRLQRILLLGQGHIRIHRLPETQFRINLELFGVLDFQKDEYLLKISLRDSKLLGSELSGDGLIYWRGDRGFIVSLGGFHPKYPAPPGELFQLSRLTASIVNRDNLKIGFECYVALTSTCFQIGGRLFLWAGAKGFSLEGLLGFDALFESNREFSIQLMASVAIKRKNRTLASVSFQGELTGVAPWRINGEVKFHILFWDISISVAYEFGSRPTTPVQTVDARALLLAALEAPANWLVNHQNLGVVLVERQRQGVWLAPNSKLSVAQNVLPLNKKITRLGASPLPQAEKFVVEKVRLGGQINNSWRFVEDNFTPSLYNEVDLEQAIRAPQFESLPAGITFDSQDNITLGEVFNGGGSYEEITIDDGAVKNVASGLVSSNMFERRSIPESDFYRSEKQAIAVKATRYVLIDETFQVWSSEMTYSQAQDLLSQQQSSGSRLSIVRVSEVPADAVVVA